MPPARGGRYARRQTNYSKIWGGLELWLCSVSAKERGLLMTVHDPKRAAVLRGLQAEECSGRGGSVQVYHRLSLARACTDGDGLPGTAAGHSGGAEGDDGAAPGTGGFEGVYAGQEEARRRHHVGVDTSREIDEASARVGMDVRLCDGATGAYDTIFVPVFSSPLPLPLLFFHGHAAGLRLLHVPQHGMHALAGRRQPMLPCRCSCPPPASYHKPPLQLVTHTLPDNPLHLLVVWLCRYIGCRPGRRPPRSCAPSSPVLVPTCRSRLGTTLKRTRQFHPQIHCSLTVPLPSPPPPHRTFQRFLPSPQSSSLTLSSSPPMHTTSCRPRA
jgi:hypothetical protein